MFKLGPRLLPISFEFDGGSDWICLSKDFIDYIVDEEHRDAMLQGLLAIYNYTILPAESFFHTALRNSQFCSSYVNNNLRLTNWKKQLGYSQRKNVDNFTGRSPMVFQINDWKRIEKTRSKPKFFARKFDAKLSQSVINKIDQWVLSGNDEILNYNLDETYNKYWENIFHHLDDMKSDNIVLDLANILVENIIVSDTKKVAQVEEITVLFVYDQLESLLVLFQSEDGLKYESQFVINSNSKTVSSSDFEISLSVGSQFDVKEHIFRHLVQVMGDKQLPQLLIRINEKHVEIKGKFFKESLWNNSVMIFELFKNLLIR